MEVLHFVFGILGNATALFLFLSPMFTFRRIIKKKTTDDFSGVPYKMALLNCLISFWYALPFVSPNNLLVLTINGTGVLIELVYVTIFLIYAPRKVRSQMMGLLALVIFVFALVAVISVLVLHGRTRKVFCGSATVIFSIFMYASPLSIMELVIRTKSVEFMPFLLSLFVFLCAMFWFIYGLLGADIFITIPNGCGGVLGAMQLILYMKYRKNKGLSSKCATACSSQTCTEMGSDKIYTNNSEKALNGSCVVNQV